MSDEAKPSSLAGKFSQRYTSRSNTSRSGRFGPKEDASTQSSFNLNRSDLSLKENLCLAFNNEEFIDTIFLVGPEQVPIKCHRILLTSQSSVFFVLFSNRTEPEATITIELLETEPEIFRNLIRFLYTEEVNISAEDAVKSCALAKDYDVKSFIVACKIMLRKKLDSKNAVQIFQQAKTSESFDLEKIVQEYICQNAKKIFTEGDFRAFSYENLCEFLRKDELIIDEFSLFKATYLWAENQCTKRGVDKNFPGKIRAMLNEAFYLIRYPLMTTEEFVLQVVDSGLFSSPETYNILALISLSSSSKKQKLVTNSDFAVRPRNVARYYVNRFQKLGSWLNNYNKSRWAIRFKVDEGISIVSIGLYGPPGTLMSKYNVKVEILNEELTDVVASSEINKEFKIVDGIFHVEFASPVTVERNVWYTASFFITKGHATLGASESGKSSVVISCGLNPQDEHPVTFEFLPAKSCNTDFQIPEICFQLTK